MITYGQPPLQQRELWDHHYLLQTGWYLDAASTTSQSQCDHVQLHTSMRCYHPHPLINGYIIAWILHHIFMFSNKVILAVDYNNDSLHYPISPFPPTWWPNWPINEFYVSKLNSPWHYIHDLYCILVRKGLDFGLFIN